MRDICITNCSIRINIHPNDVFSAYKNEKRLPFLFCLSPSQNVRLISGILLLVIFFIDQSSGFSLQAACVGSLVLLHGDPTWNRAFVARESREELPECIMTEDLRLSDEGF